MDKFPAILVVTDSAEKAKKIKDHIAKENVNNLRFEAITVQEIRQTLID